MWDCYNSGGEALEIVTSLFKELFVLETGVSRYFERGAKLHH
jgi:hypothetical protein